MTLTLCPQVLQNIHKEVGPGLLSQAQFCRSNLGWDKWSKRARNGLILCHSPKVQLHFSAQIDSWCKENSYVIAGYYQANERVKDASPNQVAEKVASRIAEGFNDTALIMVDNTKFTMECVEPAIHVYELHENKWRCKDPHVDFCEDWNEAQRIAASLLDSKSYETLVDFDNHLDDIRNDWTNPEINKAVLHLC
uniref:ER membrane protein complex subunit 8 n=1 Tax=Anas platyrhynchos platyrhynchos TaxID=8840 RepID=A0A493T9V2_ANAPP